MIRTQVTLTRKEFRVAKREARRLGISLADLVRRALRKLTALDEPRPWMRFAGMVDSADPASSRRIDDAVYGEKNRPRRVAALTRSD